jgi:hypothetical protein
MRVLLYDLETSPIIAAVWGLYDQNIQYDSILQEWFIICASWKWLDEKQIKTASILDNPKLWVEDHTNDYPVVKALYDAISQADVIVAHNNNGFDWKKFMARVVYHKLPPIPSPLMVDTLKEARRFKFTSNKLDDLSTHLGLDRKIELKKGLWLKASQGDAKSIKELARYNKGDIPPLEDLYLRLRPYMTSHPNWNLHSNKPCCPKCGGTNYQSRGVQRYGVSMFQRYRCNDCGTWFREKHSLKRARFR